MKTDTRDVRAHPERFLVAAIVLVALVVVVAALVRFSPQIFSGASEVAPGAEVPVAAISSDRATDRYGEQLDILRRQAAVQSAMSGPAAYTRQLDELSAEGRAAALTVGAADSPDAYTAALDSLRQLGQAAYIEASTVPDPNLFSEQLDALRRLGQE